MVEFLCNLGREKCFGMDNQNPETKKEKIDKFSCLFVSSL